MNIRAEGGWSLYHSLQSQVSTWRFDVYKINGQRPIPFVNYFQAPGQSQGIQYIGSFHWSFVSPLLETIVNRRTSEGFVEEDYVYRTDEYKRKQTIEGIINYARNKKECPDAFRAVGAVPIGEQLSNLTIVTENMFSEPLYDRNWTDGTEIGKAMRDELKKHPNTKDVSPAGVYLELRENNTILDSKRRFLGVTNSAFDGTEHLSVVIIHSLVHTGGVGGRDVPISEYFSLKPSITTHDLTFLGQKYKDILKHCTREGASKNL